jgi:hypothetical protein
MGQLVHVIETIAIALCRLFALGKIYRELMGWSDLIRLHDLGISGVSRNLFFKHPELHRWLGNSGVVISLYLGTIRTIM